MSFRPSNEPIPFTSKLLEEHLKDIEQTVIDSDSDGDEIFDDIEPRLNVDPKQKICFDLPPIEVKEPPKPVKPKRKQFNLPKKQTTPKVIDIEFQYEFEPARLEAPPYEIPTDYGYDYLSDQLLDLTYQFTRLSIPDITE